MDPLSRAAVVDALETPEARAPRDLSSAIYGSLLVTSLLAVQARSDATPAFVAATIIIGVAVFWLTDVWTEVIAIRIRGPIRWASVRAAARAELPMLGAAVIPVLILAAPALGLLPVDQAINLAIAAAVLQLFGWGILVGRALNRGWPIALLVALVDCALGLVIVALKVFVLH